MSEKMQELVDLVGSNDGDMPDYVQAYMFGAIDAIKHKKKTEEKRHESKESDGN